MSTTLKEFYQKPFVKETIILILNSIMAGFVLSMAAIASIFAPVWLETRILKSFIFSFGLLVIILFEMKLFTGMVANAAYTPPKKWWTLAVCLLFNALGCFVGAEIAKGAFGKEFITKAAKTFADKIVVDHVLELRGGIYHISGSANISAGAMFLSALLCGMCITIAILGCRAAKAKNFSATFFVVLPIMVFVLCGFEHSVANIIYVFMGNVYWNSQVWLLITMSVLGNVVGGVIIPVYKLVEGKKYLAAPVAAHSNPEVTSPQEDKK